MPITQDSSTPAVTTATGTGTSLTSPSFTPPRGSLLVAIMATGKSNNSSSNASVSDSNGSLSWSSAGWLSNPTANNGGLATVYTAYVPKTVSALTVTAGLPSFGTGGGSLLDVRVLNGASPYQSGVGVGQWGYTTTDTNGQAWINTVQANSFVYGVSTDTGGNHAFTVNGASTVLNTFSDSTDACNIVTWRSTSAVATPGTFSFEGGGFWATATTSVVFSVEIFVAEARGIIDISQYGSFF